MTTVFARDLVVGENYKLANTSNIRVISPDYIQRILTRPHTLIEKTLVNNEYKLVFQTDGTGEHPTFNPQIYANENQEFIKSGDNASSTNASNASNKGLYITYSKYQGGKKRKSRKQNRKNNRRNRKDRKTMNKRKSTNTRK